MKIVNIHEAKTHLSRLIEGALEGEPFIIAKAGRPLVKVVQLASGDDEKPRRLGFLAGQFAVPAEFNSMTSGESGRRQREEK